jgi:hypothetical protein
LRSFGITVGRVDNLSIKLSEGSPRAVEEAVTRARGADPTQMATPIEEKTIDDLKFSVCLPHDVAVSMLQRRMTDHEAIRAVLSEPVEFLRTAGSGE